MRFRLFAIGVLLLIASLSAQDGLLWQTSFTAEQGFTADWLQCPSGDAAGGRCPGGWNEGDEAIGLPNDGFSTHLNYTDGAGVFRFGSRIVEDANNPCGAGGRGFLQYLADGDDQVSGGLMVQLPTSYPEVWLRWYQRWSPKFRWSPLIYRKDIYWNVGQSPFQIVGFYQTDAWYTHVSSNRGEVNIESSIDFYKLADGKWHALEQHMKTNTRRNNGELHMWADNKLVLSRKNIDYGEATFSFFALGSNEFNPHNGKQGGYTQFDDVAVSATGRIGPINGC